MSTQIQAILDAALALPEAERILVAERLLESLPAEVDDLSEDELAAELDRRYAEFLQDPSVAAPWSEVKKVD